MAHYRAELTGVFGDPVDDNPTCVLEEAAYAALGLNYRYLTIKVLPEDLETAMASVRAMHFRGINLTMPHKIKVIPMLDELSEAAQIIGAVNTVVNDNGRLTGENTDGKGFTTALKNGGVQISGTRIMVLGAGGAARAICVECALNGASHITIVNRTQGSGSELADLINATPIGFTPAHMQRPDIDYDTVREGMVAADVVFDPVDTLFLEECGKNGARCFNGIGMLVQQGALNFTMWTGKEAPVDVMYDALAKEIQG